MYYLRVKEASEEVSQYTDGIYFYNIHETSVGVDNANPDDLFAGENIKEAMIYFGLTKIEIVDVGEIIFT